FLIIGVPYAVVLGIIAGLFEFIPLAGPLTVATLAVLLASFHSPGQALAVFLFLVVLRIIHDYVTYPRIIGQGIHLHPLAVILAILCGAELAGIAGIFLAIPAIAIISVAYRHWTDQLGPGAASGWYWTEKTGSCRWRLPSTQLSLRLMCVTSTSAGRLSAATAKP